ncbi:hypothetical protein ACFX2F_006936 [Malus domestica]
MRECCPPMDLFRSEPMQVVQIIIPIESAHLTVSHLDDLGLIQFKDHQSKLRKSLWHLKFRATRGNVFLRPTVVENPVIDPVSGEKVEKKCFCGILLWGKNKEVRNDAEKPSFLLSKASPLNTVDSAAAQNGLSTRLPEFCSAANLLCFPDDSSTSISTIPVVPTSIPSTDSVNSSSPPICERTKQVLADDVVTDPEKMADWCLAWMDLGFSSVL